MADTLSQNVITESFSTVNGDTLLSTSVLMQLLSSGGSVGPAGPQGPQGIQGGEEEMPEFPIVDVKTSSALAAGASVNLDSVVVAALKIGKLQQITLSSSAACKWEIQKSTAEVATTLDVVFTSGFSGNAPTHEWEPPHKDYAELAGNGTTTFFRVVATNLDARNPANVYSTFMFDEVDV